MTIPDWSAGGSRSPTCSPAGDPAGTGRGAAWFAQECSAALTAFLSRCPPYRTPPGPWTWLPLEADCRRIPDDPAGILADLRQEFPDRVLRGAQLICGAAELPTLLSSLASPAAGYLIPVRAVPGGPIIDILTPRGLLSSSDVPPFLVPILPARRESLPEEDIVFGTVDPTAVVVLHSLGLPALLLRRARGTSLTGLTRLAGLRGSGNFQITSVAGCRPFLQGPTAASLVEDAAADLVEPSSLLAAMWLTVLGFPLMELQWDVPRGMPAVLRFVQFVREALDVDLAETALVSAPSQEQLHQLQQRLSCRDRGLVRAWFLEQALTQLGSWDQYHAWCLPEDGAQVLRPYDTVRREIQSLLRHQTRWSTFDLDHLQQLHDELVAAIDRDILDLLLDRAAQAGDAVAGLTARLLASTSRAWLIVEPYADVAQIPPQLRLRVDLEGHSVAEFCATHFEKLRQFLRSQGLRRGRAL